MSEKTAQPPIQYECLVCGDPAKVGQKCGGVRCDKTGRSLPRHDVCEVCSIPVPHGMTFCGGTKCDLDGRYFGRFKTPGEPLTYEQLMELVDKSPTLKRIIESKVKAFTDLGAALKDAPNPGITIKLKGAIVPVVDPGLKKICCCCLLWQTKSCRNPNYASNMSCPGWREFIEDRGKAISCTCGSTDGSHAIDCDHEKVCQKCRHWVGENLVCGTGNPCAAAGGAMPCSDWSDPREQGGDCDHVLASTPDGGAVCVKCYDNTFPVEDDYAGLAAGDELEATVRKSERAQVIDEAVNLLDDLSDSAYDADCDHEPPSKSHRDAAQYLRNVMGEGDATTRERIGDRARRKLGAMLRRKGEEHQAKMAQGVDVHANMGAASALLEFADEWGAGDE